MRLRRYSCSYSFFFGAMAEKFHLKFRCYPPRNQKEYVSIKKTKMLFKNASKINTIIINKIEVLDGGQAQGCGHCDLQRFQRGRSLKHYEATMLRPAQIVRWPKRFFRTGQKKKSYAFQADGKFCIFRRLGNKSASKRQKSLVGKENYWKKTEWIFPRGLKL